MKNKTVLAIAALIFGAGLLMQTVTVGFVQGSPKILHMTGIRIRSGLLRVRASWFIAGGAAIRAAGTSSRSVVCWIVGRWIVCSDQL